MPAMLFRPDADAVIFIYFTLFAFFFIAITLPMMMLLITRRFFFSPLFFIF